MKQRYFNGVPLTEESIMETRLFFANNCYNCINLVKEGRSRVYIDHQKYFDYEQSNARDYMSGDNDHIMAFLQYAYFIQTGESVPLLH